jgi:hypothetical protein
VGSQTENNFKRAVVVTLAKRAANRCSNPDCGAITSGPSETPSKSVNVGEAAHIFGANPGSARYDEGMSSAARSEITNAIWLCGNCHKLVDDDALKYPAGLLFEWQKEHERVIAAAVGKAGAEARGRYERRHLEEFGKLSYLAERIITEKGDCWEYLLTSEVLRFEMKYVLQRWGALKRGLYTKPHVAIGKLESLDWLLNRSAEIQGISAAFSELMNVEFARSWGEPGVAGDDLEIVTTCRLFAEMCMSALAWEESVRFVRVPEAFSEVQQLHVGVAGMLIDESAKVPAFLTEMLAGELKGTYSLSLTLSLPDGWADEVGAALEKAAEEWLDD